MPVDGLKPGGRLRPNKRTRERQMSTLQQMMVLDDVSEEHTVETVPDHLSTSASETSSKASNSSQPPLLDFMGATCNASAWFTSCFPCAVVDINDSDDYVVDKLSRESAMNVMYAKDYIADDAASHNSPAVSADDAASYNSPAVSRDSSPVFDGKQSRGSEEQDKNLVYVRLPEHMTQKDAPIHSIPSMIVEEDSQDEDAMDTISLTDDGASMPVPVTPESMDSDSGIVDDSDILDDGESPFLDASVDEASENENPQKSPPKKKKKFGMKLFGRKKKA